MSLKTKLHAHWQTLIMAALSVAVFSFWLFLRPYVILAREQSQLFLWNREYFLERITIPGGLAQYVGEFVVQFFINPIYGAIIYAIVCAAAFWLMQQLTKGAKHSTAFSLLFAGLIWWLTTNIYIPMTPVVATLTTLSVLCLLARLDRPFIPMLILTPLLYWLVGPAAIVLPLALIFPRFRRPKRRLSMVQSGVLLLLLVLCLVGSSWVAPYPLRQIARGIDYYWEDKHRSTPEEMKYDMLMRQRKWQSIAQQYQSERPQSPAIEGAAALSMFQLQQIGQTELANALSSSNQLLRSQSSAFIMSDVYMQMAMVNMAQRAAFEAMESVPNHNKSGRALLRLTETNIVTGQYDVARRYIGILQQTLFYRGVVEKLNAIVKQSPEAPLPSTYAPLREAFLYTGDAFFY